MRFARALLGVAAVFLIVLTGSPAAAHASLLSSDPSENAVVAETPDRIVLTFNEPVRLDIDAVHGFRADGSDWAISAEATDNRVVITPDEDPGTGTVLLTWKVISADGHTVGSALTFSIGARSTGPVGTTSAQAASTTVAALRWLALGLLAAGVLGLAGVALSGNVGAAPPLWNVVLASAVLLVPLERLYAGGLPLRDLLDWLTWLDGITSLPTLLLVAGVVLAARLVTTRARGPMAAALAAGSLAAVVAFAATASGGQPTAHATRATRATHTGSTTYTAALGATGNVALVVHPPSGRSVHLDLNLTATDGRPLEPLAVPSLRVTDDEVTLGDATLRRTGQGRYRTTLTIPRDGPWQAEVSVRVDKFDNPVAFVPFEVP